MLRGGKGVIRDPAGIGFPVSAGLRQRLHAAADPGDILVLGDDEGDQHLPGILTQDADPFFPVGCCPEERIFNGVNPLTDAAVVFVKVKVPVPESAVLVFRTVKIIEPLTGIQRSDIQAGVSGYDTVGVRTAGTVCFSFMPCRCRPGTGCRLVSGTYGGLCLFPAETLPALRCFFQIKIIRYLCDQFDIPLVSCNMLGNDTCRPA